MCNVSVNKNSDMVSTGKRFVLVVSDPQCCCLGCVKYLNNFFADGIA